MAFSTAMYIRDTALKFRQRGLDLTRESLNNIQVNRTAYQGSYGNHDKIKNPYEIDTDHGKENINWLL